MLVRMGLLALILSATLAQPASALTRFVACHEGESLQAAVDAADPGDVLILTGHCEDVDIHKSLTLQGFFLDTPVIGPGSGGSPAVGIYAGQVVMENLKIEPNPAPIFGKPGMIVAAGSLTARHLLIERGQADGFAGYEAVGGGLRVYEGASATLVDSAITNSRAGDAGGAIYNAGRLELHRTTLTGNRSTNREGGGVHNTPTGELVIEASTITRSLNHRIGGGLYNGGRATVVRSTISGNRADLAGGGISNAGTLSLSDTAVIDNDAVSTVASVYPVGGGLSTGPGSTTYIRRSTLGGNAAKAGGGIWNDDATLDLRATTISGNTSIEGGPGISGTTGTIWAESVVLAGNTSSAGAESCGGSFTWVSYGGNYRAPGCGPEFPGPGDSFGTDPELAPAADNGGPTFTMRTLPGSPVVDAGRCVKDGVGDLQPDQRAVVRPQGLRCDVGAYENRPPADTTRPYLTAGVTPGRTGDYTLGWDPVTDPDGDPVTHRLQYGILSSTESFPVGDFSTGLTHQFSGIPEGIRLYRVVATDGNARSTSPSTFLTVVVDQTAPAAPTITADREPEHVDAQGPWFRDEVVVTATPGLDPGLAGGGPGSGFVTPQASTHTFDTAGRHEVSRTSTDAAGNESARTALVVHVDDSAPELTLAACPATLLLGATASVGWTASDSGAGLVGAASGDLALDASSVGTKTARIEVADRVGHTSEASCAYEVVYAFSGFDAPLRAAPPALNVIGIGTTVAVRFGLGGGMGLGVLAGAPAITPIACDTKAPTGAPFDAVAQRPLSYDATRQQYTYSWQTMREWKKTCARFALELDDGTVHAVNISFR